MQSLAYAQRLLRAAVSLALVVGAFGACTSDSPVALEPTVNLAKFTAGRDTAAAAARLRAELSARVDRRAFVAAATESAPSITARQSIPVHSAWGVAVNGAGLAVVTSLYAQQVTFINTATGTILGTTPVGDIPSSAGFNRTGTIAFIGNQHGGTLSAINVATRAVIATIPLFDEPYSMAMSPNGVHLYVGTSTGWIRTVDVTTLTVVDAFQIGGYLNGLAIDSAGKRLFASTMFAGTLHEVDLATRSVLRTFPLGGIPQGISLGPLGNRLLIANEAGFLSDLNIGKGTWVNYAAVGGLFGLTTKPDFSHATMTVPYSSVLQAYLPPTKQIRSPFLRGGEPRRAAYHKAGNVTVVTNFSGWVDLVR